MGRYKYFWISTQTGEFSYSWDVELRKHFMADESMKDILKKGYRLIKYQCLNDENFEFTKEMKLR